MPSQLPHQFQCKQLVHIYSPSSPYSVICADFLAKTPHLEHWRDPSQHQPLSALCCWVVPRTVNTTSAAPTLGWRHFWATTISMGVDGSCWKQEWHLPKSSQRCSRHRSLTNFINDSKRSALVLFSPWKLTQTRCGLLSYSGSCSIGLEGAVLRAQSWTTQGQPVLHCELGQKSQDRQLEQFYH